MHITQKCFVILYLLHIFVFGMKKIIPNRVVRIVIRWKRAVCEAGFLMVVIRKINLQKVCYQIVAKETTEKGFLMTDLG